MYSNYYILTGNHYHSLHSPCIFRYRRMIYKLNQQPQGDQQQPLATIQLRITPVFTVEGKNHTNDVEGSSNEDNGGISNSNVISDSKNDNNSSSETTNSTYNISNKNDINTSSSRATFSSYSNVLENTNCKWPL